MADAPEFPEPLSTTGDPAALLPRYLEWLRETVVRKVESLPEEERRSSRLPSGWTPLELLSHLAHMEQRWFVWGFLGEQVDAPWGDRAGERWHVPDGTTCEDLVRFLRSVGERSSEVLAKHALDETGAVGGRFHEDPPTLGWVSMHVLQEYARHAGHLDVAVELAGGPLGE
jgi:uncharacterized damage-inducible protein DinB